MIVSLLLFLAGVLHLLPVTGILGKGALTRLYGVDISDPDLVILMQHRAVLFALLGGVLLLGAVVPAHRWLAISAGLISTLAFLAIAWSAPEGYGPALRRVVIADLAAIVALTAAGILTFFAR